jgi:hypothetical protein
MTKRTESHRTIHMPPSRARQVALGAAYMGLNGEQFIQAAISQALASLARNDHALSMLIGDIGDGIR